MSPDKRWLLFLLTFLVIFVLIPGLSVLDFISVPKPIAKYSQRIMDIWNDPIDNVVAYSKHSITSSPGASVSNTRVIGTQTVTFTTAKINASFMVSTNRAFTKMNASSTVPTNHAATVASSTESTNRAVTRITLASTVYANRPVTTNKATSVTVVTTPDNSSAGHREKTYTETFLEVPNRHFTDILGKPPVDFLPNFKNPCWIEKVNSGPFTVEDGDFKGRIRCLPYFFLIGFPKCGTTDLYRRFAMHPEIKPPCAKEPHWWTRARYYNSTRGHLYSYLNCFDKASQQIAQSKNYTFVTSALRTQITMDCSASTAWDESHWRLIPQNNITSDDPSVTNVHAIHHLLPKAKIIVIMRNPINRLYSDYLYFQRGVSRDRFHAKVVKSMAALEACFQNRSPRSCVHDIRLQAQAGVRLHVGLYSIYLEEWLSLYPREQFLFLRTEDYGANVTQSLVRAFRFLDLDVPDEADLQQIEEKPNANTRSKSKSNVGEMLPETRTLLENFYSPWNKKLSLLLQDDGYTWK